MLGINWGDVMNVLKSVIPHLIAIGVVLVLAIILTFAVNKKTVKNVGTRKVNSFRILAGIPDRHSGGGFHDAVWTVEHLGYQCYGQEVHALRHYRVSCEQAG